MRASSKHFLLATLFATAIAVPAIAQSAPPTNYPACTATPSKQDSEQAHSAFLLGKRFFDEADYGSAIHNFVDAYKLDCTKTELLTIIARAHELTGDRQEAVHALETYLQRAQNVSADDKAQIQKRIDNLRAQMSAQQPTAPTASTATAAPTTQASTSPTPTPTETATVPQPPPPSPHGAGPWVVVALGGAALVTGGVLLGIGLSDVSDALAKCGSRVCSNPAAKDEGNQGRTFELVGPIVGGVGLAAVVAGLIWHFSEGSSAPRESHTSIRPVVGPGYAGAAAGGVF